MYKNIAVSEVLDLGQLVDVRPGQVISRTLVQNEGMSVTLFAFDQNEEISSHQSEGDALVSILEGEAQITIGEKLYRVRQGESIVMPKGIAHALLALSPFKMILVVSF